MTPKNIIEKCRTLRIYEERCVDEEDYGELVFFAEETEAWTQLLTALLGPATKPAGKKPSGDDLRPECGAWRAIHLAGQFPKRYRGNFDVDVDAIEQRTADFGHVAVDLRNAAVAVPPRIVAVAARAWVERGDEHEIGRERGAR